jgi:hypothetical protein
MEHYPLTKKNWKILNDLGLVDGVGNGFANTTKKFDDNILCSSFDYTIIKINKTMYAVKYYSGCFYPCWTIVYDVNPNYTINKDSSIERN